VIALTVLSQIMNLAFLRIWGKFTDQFSNKSVLALCGPLFLACILAWTFTTMPEKHLGTIPLLVAIHMFMGISIAGVTLASGNIALKSAPKEQATAYLAANGIVNSLAAGIGPILGGKFADFFAARELSLTLNWRSPVREVAFYTLNFQHWDFFFFLAFLIGLYSIHRLMKVREVGEVEEKIVINEFLSEIRRPLSNLSTVGGLRQMIVFPVSFFRNMAGINHSPANKME
jgi:MFS family permease